jgi:hypothetical protein
VKTFSVPHSIVGETSFDFGAEIASNCDDFIRHLRAAADCKAPHVANPNSHFASRKQSPDYDSKVLLVLWAADAFVFVLLSLGAVYASEH